MTIVGTHIKLDEGNLVVAAEVHHAGVEMARLVAIANGDGAASRIDVGTTPAGLMGVAIAHRHPGIAILTDIPKFGVLVGVAYATGSHQREVLAENLHNLSVIGRIQGLGTEGALSLGGRSSYALGSGCLGGIADTRSELLSIGNRRNCEESHAKSG